VVDASDISRGSRNGERHNFSGRSSSERSADAYGRDPDYALEHFTLRRWRELYQTTSWKSLKHYVYWRTITR